MDRRPECESDVRVDVRVPINTQPHRTAQHKGGGPDRLGQINTLPHSLTPTRLSRS
jgi:hypothetical protein